MPSPKDKLNKQFKEISDTKVIAIAAMIVGLAIVIGISSDESQDTINSQAGLEQCIIPNGRVDNGGKLVPKTIWVKSCSITLKTTKQQNNKIKGNK